MSTHACRGGTKVCSGMLRGCAVMLSGRAMSLLMIFAALRSGHSECWAANAIVLASRFFQWRKDGECGSVARVYTFELELAGVMR